MDPLFIHRLVQISDYIFPAWGRRYDLQYKMYGKGLLQPESVKPGSVIYADQTHLECLDIFEYIKVPFILITCEGDCGLPGIARFVLDNPSLIRWYGLNVLEEHPKLVCIPIGLNKSIPRVSGTYMEWYVNVCDMPVEKYMRSIYADPLVNILRKDKKILYINHTVENSDGEKCLHQFKDIRRDSVDVLERNGFKARKELCSWEEYMNELMRYKFCLSLPGRGLDCFRTWEALYVGVIPVVMSSSLNTLYEDLPVVIITDVGQITVDFLEEKFREITVDMSRYNFYKLDLRYWVGKIKDDLRIKMKYEMDYVSCDFAAGGLGNRLFQIAVATEYGKLYNKKPVFKDIDKYYHEDSNTKWISAFINVSVIPGEEYDKIDFLHVNEVENNMYHPIPRFEGNVMFHGFFQAYGYISEETRQVMISHVYANNEYVDRAVKIYEGIKMGNSVDDDDDYVFMHVRRGDYFTTPDFHVIDPEYYRKAYEAVGGDKHVIVFSNDLKWCRETMKYPKITFIDTGCSYTELLLMSLIKHSIIANSTFSWWGAFISRYGDKKVVAPSNWFPVNCSFAKRWDGMYLPGWIVI